MNISVFYDHITEANQQSKKSVEDLLKETAGFGISALEVNLSQINAIPNFPQLLEKSNLKVSCIYEFYDWTHNQDFEKAKIHVDTAKKFGASRILVVPGFITNEEADFLGDCSDYSETAKKMESIQGVMQIQMMLQKICNYALTQNITVTLEDFDAYNSPCSHMNQLLWWFRNVEGLKHTFDMGNYIYSKEDCLKAFDLLKNYIVHVHCKDRGENLACVPAGGGLLPVADLVRKIKNLDYKGYFAIEHFGAPDQEKFIKSSADFLLSI